MRNKIMFSVIGVGIVCASVVGALRESSREKEVLMAPGSRVDIAGVGERAPASIAPSTAPVGSVEALPKETTPLTYFQKEVAAYSKLVRKIFPNEGDVKEKQALFGSLEFMKAMGQRLLKPALNAKALEEQDLAMDFLFEALNSEQELVAEGLLRDVIVDKQVEDRKLSPEARENLAGLKGEVLHRWTSMRPHVSEKLQQELPGPVSERVWANVVEAQAVNMAESSQEMDGRPVSH